MIESRVKSRSQLYKNNYLITISIIVLIFLTIFNSSKHNASLSNVFLAIIIFALGILFDRPTILIKRVHVYGTFLILLIFLSTSISNFGYADESFRTFLIFIALFMVVSSISFSQKSISRIIRTYIITTFICCIFVVFNAFADGLNIGTRYSLVFMGVRTDSNYMTAFITPGICLALIHLINSNKNRAFYTVVSVLGFTTILLASSRGSFLTLLIITGIIITHFMLKKKFSVGKIVIFLVFLLSIAFFFFYIQGNEKYIRLTDYESYVDNVRLQIWSTGIELFNENKVIGNGFNSASNYTKSRIGFYTHNNFLDILIEQGVMGILLHILLFRNMLKVSLKNKIYILVLILAFFIPLFFINGYGTATFWTPMIFCQLISDYLKKEDILFYDLY